MTNLSGADGTDDASGGRASLKYGSGALGKLELYIKGGSAPVWSIMRVSTDDGGKWVAAASMHSEQTSAGD